jgi:hypothetical protein
MKEQTEIDGKFLDKIISVAYGNGSLFDKIEVHIKANSNPLVKKILYDYKATSKAVRYASKEYKLAAHLNIIKSELYTRDSFFISLFARLCMPNIIKAAYSAGAVTIIVIISIFFLLRPPRHEPAYSKEQIALAEKQVKESFALVEKILVKAQNKTTEDVIRNNVLRPIQKGNVIINNLLN